MSTPLSGSEKKRRKKRQNILKTLEVLQSETPITRIQMMDKKFGPYWYYLLPLDGKIPDDLKHTGRYLDWVNSVNPDALKFF